MEKHVELDKATISSVMEWKNRERKLSVLNIVQAALESAMKQNGHVSFVEMFTVALKKDFYTLWDGEIVGNLIISFYDESVTFLHNNVPYKFSFKKSTNSMRWELQAMVEAYALDYDEFEKLILSSANVVGAPKGVAHND